MKKLILLLLFLPLLAWAQKTPHGVTYDTKIVRVIDGDTVVIRAPFLPQPLKPELAVRIYGVDSPEKGVKAQCASENQRGKAASAFTKHAVTNTRNHQVVIYRWDKFGGRILGDIILDGVSLRDELIRNGHVKEYFGDAKQSWC